MSAALRSYAFGVGFGFLLTRVGATEHATIARMFLLEDLHLAGVMAVAIIIAGVGLAWFRRRGTTGPAGEALPLGSGPPRPAWAPGALLFGAGWGLTGACPGTALALAGHGHWMGVATVLGVFAGSALYAAVGDRLEAAWQQPVRPATPAAL